MEIGLIHPPVGLNLYIVNAIAPDVPLVTVMWGTLPYVICMMLPIVFLCVFPGNRDLAAGHADGRSQVNECGYTKAGLNLARKCLIALGALLLS